MNQSKIPGKFLQSKQPPKPEIFEETQNVPLPQPVPIQQPEEEKTKNEEQKPEAPAWKEGSAAIAGKYADVDVVEMENGKYRMYYSAEPEVQGFKGQVYSAVSSDGISWTQENGIRMEWAIFPSVIKTPDGRYRMYFQNNGVIKSAISSDGLSWKEESGIRMDA